MTISKKREGASKTAMTAARRAAPATTVRRRPRTRTAGIVMGESPWNRCSTDGRGGYGLSLHVTEVTAVLYWTAPGRSVAFAGPGCRTTAWVYEIWPLPVPRKT